MKTCYFGNFGNFWLSQSKSWYQFVASNFGDIVKTFETCYFGNFGNVWLSQSKSWISISICMQKINYITHFFLKILQRNSTRIVLGNLDIPGYTPKMIVLTCKRLQCLFACQKYTSSLTSFLRYYILKNLAIWLADSILAHNSRGRILPNMGLLMKYQ